MVVDASVSGPLFSGQIHIARAQRAAMERVTLRAAEIARSFLRARTRYSTAKYGHAVDSVRTKIQPVPGSDQLIGKAFIGGQAAYLAPWLEFGTKAHPIPNVRERTRGGRTRLHRKLVVLPISTGGRLIFRASANHPGARAFRWAEMTQQQVNREAAGIFEKAFADETKQ